MPSPRPDDVVDIINELRDEEKRNRDFEQIRLDSQEEIMEMVIK